jgi:hypothetical protein
MLIAGLWWAARTGFDAGYVLQDRKLLSLLVSCVLGSLVIMHLRFSLRSNATAAASAMEHSRTSVASTGQTKPDVLMNRGRVDRFDLDRLRRLAASSKRHFR